MKRLPPSHFRSVIPAKGCVKNYHWGKIGSDNHIAQFQAIAPRTPTRKLSKQLSSENNNNNGVNIVNNNLPLAELWFGSHPSGPALLNVGDQLVRLDEFLSKEPDMVGNVAQYYKYDKQLPFLFKILSVAQPLSLQAHPDKNLAQALHKKDPKNYPDSNHKPELAVALTEFHVLCDFRPHSEILHFMENIPPLRHVVGQKAYEHYNKLVKQGDSSSGRGVKDLRAALGECFKNLMVSDKDVIVKETRNLLAKYSNLLGENLKGIITEFESLYPGDPGIFAPFFLNYLKLSPGQAIYLRANKLHAYLKGECIECMACSDNVVRAGLTTKFRDVQTLTDMLDYDPVRSSQDLILPPTIKQQDDCSIALFAPTEEFMLEKITISNRNEYVLPSVRSGSFLIVMSGKALTKDFFDLKTIHKLSFGSAGFIPPKVQLRLTDIKGTLVMYRAFC